MKADLFAEMLAKMEITDKQKAVLRASLQLFSDKGFEETSTRDIAKKAHVSEGTVYKNYRTKQAILNAIINPFLKEGVPEMVQSFKNKIRQTKAIHFKDYIQQLAVDRFEMVNHNVILLRLIIRTLIGRQDTKEIMVQEVFSVLFGDVQSEIRYYQRKNEIVNAPMNDIMRIIFGIFAAYIGPVILGFEDRIDVDKTAAKVGFYLSRALNKN